MNRIEYFLTNPEFVRWVKNPDKELDTYWKNWMEANPGSISHIKMAREIVYGIRFGETGPRAGMKEVMLAEILKESGDMDDENEIKVKEPDNPKKGLWNKVGQFHRVAAILVIALVFSWILLPTDSKDMADLDTEDIPIIEKIIGHGEKLSFTLPDGTRVWLNSGSSIQYPEQFPETERAVILKGEGYFEVQKDAARPFKVNSGGFVTTALGTSFNVNTKSPETVRVSLLTGQVSVGDGESEERVLLDPGQEFQHNIQEQKSKVTDFNAERVLAWKEGKIIFDNANLPQIVQQLEEWYGVKITLVNAGRAAWNFSGEYQKQSLDNVLNSISYIERFEFKIKGKEVEIRL